MSELEKHYSGSDEETSKPGLLNKKKKKSDKQPGYKMFDGDLSDSEPVIYDDSVKAPMPKLKKHSKPSFKFSGKIKLKEKEKDEKKEKSEKDKNDDKDAIKLKVKSKDKEKDMKVRKKKNKAFSLKPSNPPVVNVEADAPVFGVALSLAVERMPSNDGIMLPVCVRECIDYIEEHGLLYEGIYRISGVKSKVQMLKQHYNRRQSAYLYEHDPSIVASLLKLFLREIPDPLLTPQLMPKFEEASVVMSHKERSEKLKLCISSLPPCNKELLSWMIVHMNHVIAKEKINKMSLQNVSIVLSPTMRISHRVLNVLFMHSQELFSHVKIIRYVPPLQPAASKWSVDMPDTEEAIEEELKRQENILNQLHHELSKHTSNPDQEDRLWEVQRNVTQLKRKLKLIAKTNAAKKLEREKLTSEDMSKYDPKRRSINAAELNFALQPASLHRSKKTDTISSSPSVSLDALPVLSDAPSSDLSADSKAYTGESTAVAEVARPKVEELNLDLSSSSLTEVHNDRTPVSPDVNYLQKPASNPQSPDEFSKTLTEKHLINAKIDNSVEQAIAGPDAVGPDTDMDLGEMKKSASQDSDATISAASMGISGSLSQQSFTERAIEQEKTETIDQTVNTETNKKEDNSDMGSQLHVEKAASDIKQDTDEVNEEDEMKSDVKSPLPEEAALEPATDGQDQHQLTDDSTNQSEPEHILQQLLIPEKLHDVPPPVTEGPKQESYKHEDDDELKRLIAEEAQLIWEEEELIAIKDELRQKIDAEMVEIDRLHEEIAEYEELRSIATLGHSSEAMSSDEYYSSTSDTDPESGEDAHKELDTIVTELDDITKKNELYEKANQDLVQKIHDERIECLNIKIQIRLLQQQILSLQTREQSLI